MRLTLKDSLPFVTIALVLGERQVEIPDVLIDTGSAATVLAIDCVATVGIEPAPNDILHTIRGVGGYETVFVRHGHTNRRL